MTDQAGLGTARALGGMQTAPARTSHVSSRRLAHALLAYMLAIAGIVTLVPFQFAWPDVWRLRWLADPLDVAANVLLFVPIGFLWCFARNRRDRRATLGAVLFGSAVSLAIESAQLFEATRDSTLLDVVANASGAWLGAWAQRRLASTAELAGRIIGWLALDLPLMTLVYLLVPLLWINSLASHGDAHRGVLTLLIGVFGAVLLGGMQRNYFGPAGTAQPHDTAAFATLWFLAGAFPSLAWRPAALPLAALAIGLVCWWQGAQRAGASGASRRFEVPLLRAAAPAYLGYLLLTVLAPLAAGTGTWSMRLGFPESASNRLEILRFLELIAAYTLVGYMVAEFGGRVLRAYRHALPRVVVSGLMLGIVGEALRGYHPAHGASIARALILAAAVLYGGWLYFIQRDHIITLLHRTPGTGDRQS